MPNPILQFSALAVLSLRSDLERLLKNFAEERGLKVELDANLRYNAGELRVAVTLRTPDHAQQVDGRKATRDEAVASLLGLPRDIVGQSFAFRRNAYKVVEIHPSRPKFPIIGERIPDGKRFKFQVDAVLSGMKKAG